MTKVAFWIPSVIATKLLEVELVEAAIFAQHDGLSKVKLNFFIITDYVTYYEPNTRWLYDQMRATMGHFCLLSHFESNDTRLVVCQDDWLDTCAYIEGLDELLFCFFACQY